MTNRLFALAGLLLSASAALADGPHFDYVIRGGRVIDGTGNAWRHADVGVAGDKITFVGGLADGEFTAGETIDANGMVVAPGFIDVHTHADEGLYERPEAENFVRDGVTTIITGNCGASVGDVGEYFRRLAEKPAALNVATLYGHNTVLRAVKGDVAGELTPEQMDRAKEMVDKAMRDGAVGMSTGLIYTPGEWSDTQEIIDLQKVAAGHGGIYVTHMRSEGGGIVAAIEEALRVGREADSPVQISHFKLSADYRDRVGGSQVTLKMVDDARAAGQEVWVDQYPYTASSTGITTLLPSWLKEQGGEKMREMLDDPAQVERALADMRENYEVARGRDSMEYVVIGACRAFPQFDGHNLKEVAQMMATREDGGEMPTTLPAEGARPDVSMADQYRAALVIAANGGASCVFHSMAEEDVANIMRHPLVAICSDSGVRAFGEGHPHPRGYGSNARVLGHYVRDEKLITLEEAVRKMTSLPATAFGLSDRGLLREGFVADLVVFDPDAVRDNATFAQPHQYSTGFARVMVNGVPVVEGDELLAARPGRPVMGPAVE